MSVFKQSKSGVLISSIACAVCLFWAVSASAMENDKMSDDQATAMQEGKAANGMSHDDGMKEDSMSGDESMSHDDGMKKDSMSGDESMSHDDGMKKEDQ